MKRIVISFLSLLFCATLSAQTKTVVYGNLGVENVNISVIGTQQGTVTNAMGDYTLTLMGKGRRINLNYSCIGYQDTIVGLTPARLQRDSINISFKMRKQDYTLKDKPHNIYFFEFLLWNGYLPRLYQKRVFL